MIYYFAPLEGITGYIFRNAFEDWFGGADAYFSPFISPNMNLDLNTKEKKDVLPENNRNLTLIPQILTNRADYFISTAKQLEQLGYTSVNLNLGCPSRTVIGKKKGSGLLMWPDLLDKLLEEIYDGCPIPVSIKTRIGKNQEDAEDFAGLMEIYNQYPVQELTIHPRVQEDFYRNTPNLEAFAEGFRLSKCPVCYNGDIVTVEDERRIRELFPELDRIMIGRGALRNPGLFREIRGEKRMTKETLEGFLDRLCEDYSEVMSGEIPVLFKMKEVWTFLFPMFSSPEKYAKKIKKAKNLEQYRQAKQQIFEEQEIIPD